MKTSQDETDLFPAFAAVEAQASQQRHLAGRERRIQEHRISMAVCWPEWTGPLTGGPGASAFCEVGGLDALSLTHGERRYHYMAPCRIESVSPDGLTIIAVVGYDRPCPCADLYNGERLCLDITEVWPPVWLLSAQRRGQPACSTTTTATHLHVHSEVAA